MTGHDPYDVPLLLTTAGATLNVAGLAYMDLRLNAVGLIPGVIGVAIAYGRFQLDQ